MKGTRPTPLTREEIPAVEARIAKALAGDWHNPGPLHPGSRRGVYQHAPSYPPQEPNRPVCLAYDEDTAIFIAASKVDLPRAVAGTRAWWELRARMSEEATRQQERHDEWEANGSASPETMHAAWHTAMVLRALLEPPKEPSNGD